MSTQSIADIPAVSAEDHWVEPLEDGTHVLIRPLRPEDREREVEFIRNLSPETRHFRFLCAIKEASPALLERLMDVDYQRRMAFVALVHQDGKLVEVGICRYADTAEPGQCECAVTVADGWQERGLGAVLMRHLIQAARENGFKEMYSMDAAANAPMHALARELGFQCNRDPQDSAQVIYSLLL
ncbi:MULTISPECIES: GNAT family N-acetyltransferase [Pseudomonas]|uniref:GNAT family N-acetyltransferase n=1 Tax=Pseudomonadaceae TaxID=135621 RepID=UPI0003F57252|nr:MULTISPECIES: GNAT family N-acetyltransferase [Pseudomonas]MDE3738826.1 GNAT family N-acetyltransferase [Pseudomonas resinovorans]